jgi:hypothetical protein
MNQADDGRLAAPPGAAVTGALTILLTAGALVVYKASTSLMAIQKALQSGTLRPKAEWLASAGMPGWLKPLLGTVNYFTWVGVALGFGVVLGAMVKALLPERWLLRTVAGSGHRGYMTAALAGAPLMLCSCCIAPVFEGVYERTRRLGPALGLMLASPALNPAALTLTFLLFPADLAWARLLLSVLLVAGVSLGLGAIFDGPAHPPACPAAGGSGGRLRAFAAALREVAVRSLPPIALGVLASMVLTLGLFPVDALARTTGSGTLITLLLAAVATAIALPTFGEIPLGLALLHAGAPAGAVLALLVASPAVNLPSLLTLRKIVSGRAALAVGGLVFLLAAAGGLLTAHLR